MLRVVRLLRRHFYDIDIGYLRKWLLIGGLVGIVAGIGSIAFFSAISWSSKLFLETGAGFVPPAPVGEGQTVITAIGRRWMIPVMTTLGGLLSGLIVYKLAPEAEGHGTDAAIDAFHNKEGEIRARVPLIKLVASAITIGSGGSAGREGPTAQIAAGFGSLLGRFLKLTVPERRIALAAGIGAGIGAIFKAPLGGAILSTEILYLEGFEVSALIPSFIASIIGYTIFSSWAGYTPIFGGNFNVTFDDAYSLIFYAVLGVICGGVGIIYPRVFYGMRDLFRRLKAPNYFKPAIGGLCVGIMGLFLPQVLGMGYGWLQIVMQPQVVIPIGIMVLLAFAKILATSLSIGSGGSGGVFAPGLFIGGMLGAAFWGGLHGTVPHVPATPEPFVVVGMMALFGGVARAPLAVMFMVGEMTGTYSMLAPAMIAVGISYVIVGRHTIYESQVESPAQSPAHRYEYSFPLLAHLKVRDTMRTDVVPITTQETLTQVEKRLLADGLPALPVLDSITGKLVGTVSGEDILRLTVRDGASVNDFMSTDLVTISPEDSLDAVMEILSSHDTSILPVTEHVEGGSTLVGIISQREVSTAYTKAARSLLKKKIAG
ncbi:MAG: chloride channel protein [Chloroflexota bacterium]